MTRYSGYSGEIRYPMGFVSAGVTITGTYPDGTTARVEIPTIVFGAPDDAAVVEVEDVEELSPLSGKVVRNRTTYRLELTGKMLSGEDGRVCTIRTQAAEGEQ